MEAELIKGCMRIIESQNIIITNLQKTVDENREEKNKQKMKNRMRVEKSKMKKKKEQCDSLKGEDLTAEKTSETGDEGGKNEGREVEVEVEAGENEERRLRKRESKRKTYETDGQNSESSQKRKKKKKKTKGGADAGLGEFSQADMIGIGTGESAFISSAVKNEGSEGFQPMEWWQPRGQYTTQTLSTAEGGETTEDANGNYNNNDNNGSGNGGDNAYKDYFTNHSNLFTQIGGIQLHPTAIDKIIEGGGGGGN